MAAKLATVDDRILARMEDAVAIREGSMIPRMFSDKPQAGGIYFDCGYLSPYFVTDPERMEVAFENAYILIHEGKIDSRKELLPLLEQITKMGKPLLIIAEDVGEEALATLVVNKLRGPLQIAAVRAPGFEDQRRRMLQELAVATGGKSVAEGMGMQPRNIQISDLGLARKITVGKNHTMVEGSANYRHLSFEAESSVQANVYTSPVPSTQIHMQIKNGASYAAARR